MESKDALAIRLFLPIQREILRCMNLILQRGFVIKSNQPGCNILYGKDLYKSPEVMIPTNNILKGKLVMFKAGHLIKPFVSIDLSKATH